MFEDCIKGYFEFLETAGLTESTRECYKRDIKVYVAFLEKHNIDLKNISHTTIRLFENSLYGKPLSTVNRNISSIRGFHRYLARKGLIEEEPKFKSKTIEMYNYNIKEHILTEDEVKTLFEVIASSKSKYAFRDKMLFELLYKCGLKISEIENMKISDINTYLEYINVTSFSKNLRAIPIDEGLNERLKTYINNSRASIETDETNRDFLFLNRDREKMTRQGIWKIIKKYAMLSGLEKNINSNTFRLSLAYNLVSNGADASIVNKYLGNKSFSIIAKVSEDNTKLRSSILKYNINLEELL